MSIENGTTRIKCEFWPPHDMDDEEGVIADLEVERDELNPDVVALFTFVDDAGSKASFYLSHDAAVRLAHKLIGATLR
jgi:hypothetical protein